MHSSSCLSILLFVPFLGLSESRCFDLRRHTRSSVNRETGLRIQRCPTNKIASTRSLGPINNDTVLGFMLWAAKHYDFEFDEALKLQKLYSTRNNRCSSKTLCSEDVFPYSIATELRTDCPYEWVVNKNVSRFPEVLMEAKILCSEPKSTLNWTKDHKDVRVECEPIRYTIPVLWRESCNLKVHKYRPGFDTITVGYVRTVSCTRNHGRILNVVRPTLPS